jgi:dihydroorotate dehydrogenase electron transfer subunit
VTIYACGPTPMMRAVASLGARANVPVFVSLEPVMGCGMGGCYSCVVRVRTDGRPRFVRSCLDGPVFDAAAVVWPELPAGH